MKEAKISNATPTIEGPPPEPPEKAKGALVSDPELAAMNRITKALNGLSEVARSRVVAYLAARFLGISLSEAKDMP